MATIFIDGPFRFFFWSKDLFEKMHVHVENADGMIKIWLPDLTVEIIHAGMRRKDIDKAVKMVIERYDEIVAKWNEEAGKIR